ncbi:MAG TPA: aspartate-semialdehyde dehydrogenase [Actinobacteria bacterium]|nr:aspartate-semialdehyde dehydrogenase [Actinomycetota bacterium]
MREPIVAVVGATGAVGRTMLRVLEERDFPVGGLRLFASRRSAGKVVATRWGDVVVEELAEADPAGIDLALFSAGGDRSRAHAPRFAEAGAVVIDNSSAFRMDPDVPLVVAGVNDAAIEHRPRGIVANPNCTTMVLLMAVAPLHRAAGLRRMFATSYQAVSGTGRAAIEALHRECELLGSDPEALVEGGWKDPGEGVYRRPIGFNVVPLAGTPGEAGYTDEEWKLVRETRKILDAPDVVVEPTCVRVPTVVGHGIAAAVWFDRPVGVDEAAELIDSADGVELWDDERLPTPLDSAGRDEVLVGRLRATHEPGGIALWVVGDNLRKGAALNAVQLAELVVA